MVRAVEAGIDLMEHAEFLDPDGELRFDPKIAEMMAESGIWISPTLQAWTGYPRIVELRTKRDTDTISGDEMTELQRLEARAEVRLDVMRPHARLRTPRTDCSGHRFRGRQSRIRSSRLRFAIACPSRVYTCGGIHLGDPYLR